jgi:hypothetical protein
MLAVWISSGLITVPIARSWVVMMISVVGSTTGVACVGGVILRVNTVLIARMPSAINPTPTTAITIPIRTRRFKVTLLGYCFVLLVLARGFDALYIPVPKLQLTKLH